MDQDFVTLLRNKAEAIKDADGHLGTRRLLNGLATAAVENKAALSPEGKAKFKAAALVIFDEFIEPFDGLPADWDKVLRDVFEKAIDTILALIPDAQVQL